MDWSKIPNLDWALQLNAAMRRKLEDSFEETHTYWTYLNELLGFLRTPNVRGVQEKIADANHIQKFYSTVSELEFARILASKGKQVTLLADDYLENRTSPDMLVTDSLREAYIEVKRLTEGQAAYNILDFLRSYLNHPQRRYVVSIALNQELSIPVTKREERLSKERIAQRIIERFPSAFQTADLNVLPTSFKIDGVTFRIEATTKSMRGYPGVIRSAVIQVPTEKWQEKFTQDVCDKAKKREGWTGEHLSKYYIVAIDCEEKYLDEDDVESCLTGSEGIFLTNPLTKNVSGVLARFVTGRVYLISNPSAYDEINIAQIQNYLD